MGTILQACNTVKPPQSIIEFLASRYPNTFYVYERRRKPLKVGIYDDIVADLGDAIPKSDLARALRSYTGNSYYLDGMSRRVPRAATSMALPYGTVTDKQVRHAQRQLQRIAEAQRRRQEASKPVAQKKGDGLAQLRAAWRERGVVS